MLLKSFIRLNDALHTLLTQFWISLYIRLHRSFKISFRCLLQAPFIVSLAMTSRL